MSESRHRWRFFRAGGVDQVRLDTGEALLALDELDPKLWVALACPTSNIEFDGRFLALLDRDGDGRVRVGDILDTVLWLRPRLKNPDDLLSGTAELGLDSLREDTPEGRELREAAQAVLDTVGKSQASRVCVADAQQALETFHQQPFNGDGVLVPDSLADAGLAEVARQMLTCFPGEMDRSGKRGVGKATVDAFFAQAKDFVAWQAERDANPTLRPLGEATDSAVEAYGAVEAKVDDYFARCRLASFDGRATPALNRDDKELGALAQGVFSPDAREAAGFPLAQVGPDKPLPLFDRVNPAWVEPLEKFAHAVVSPLLGGPRSGLAYPEWIRVRQALAPVVAWRTAQKGERVASLGRARLETLLGDGTQRKLEAELERERALEQRERAFLAVERLLLCVRDFATFCNNFVSFRDFYGRRKAIFQAGTLYLDQRSCELCIEVESAAAHVSLSPLARAYLVYCDCVRPPSGEKKTVVAALTAGDSDNIMVGRNGLFFDRQGREWDATITRIVDNPISVRQAFWSPYKKVVRFVEELVTQRAAGREAAAQAGLTQAVTTLASTSTPPPTSALHPAVPTSAENPAAAKKPLIDVGVVAALGVAVGGLTAAFGAILQAFFGLGVWMPLGFAALVFAISGPSMLLAWLKLRQRNIGPLLDANGWAVNTRARVNVAFGGALTRTAALPKGASRDLQDPFPERRPRWRLVLVTLGVALGALLWARGHFDPWLPSHLQASQVFGWDTVVPPPPAR